MRVEAAAFLQSHPEGVPENSPGRQPWDLMAPTENPVTALKGRQRLQLPFGDDRPFRALIYCFAFIDPRARALGYSVSPLTGLKTGFFAALIGCHVGLTIVWHYFSDRQ
jgi:hypothetical protein